MATADEIREFHRNYPIVYAQCRTWRHGPESPLAVKRPNGPGGLIEVSRICACGRLVTRVYTSTYVRLTDQTRVVYPKGYLALPGTGGVEKELIARHAIEAEAALLDVGTEPEPPTRGTRTTKRRKPPTPK